MLHSRLILIIVLLLFVASSNSATPQLPPRDLSKYEIPVQVEQIDLLVLEAKIEVLRWWMNNPLPFIDAPALGFNRKTKRIEAVAAVNADELNKLTTNDVKGRLSIAATYTAGVLHDVMDNFDGSKRQDFHMEFRGLSIEAARKGLPSVSTFAEFEDDKVTIR